MKKFTIFLLLFALYILNFKLYIPLVFAQTQSIDVASTQTIVDQQAVDGDILTYTDKGLERTNLPYSNKIFGVLQDKSLIVYRSIDPNAKPIARAGLVLVNVTNFDGSIKVGDYITSSTIPGKGQKASQSGYTIGVALAALDENAAQNITFQNKTYKSGQIQVALRIEYSELSAPRSLNSFFNLFGTALFTNLQNPQQFTQVVRYIAAGLAILISFSLGFFTFARAIPKGIEAIGRNPLAKNAIQFTIILNIIFTILTALAGVLASVLILRL
ncbi:hypothetical protein HY025_04145 [Candidatus Daviesbacteria bacterium]|nr:hypothetical protein [Candidatus Daviesbacteria bacterium]